MLHHNAFSGGGYSGAELSKFLSVQARMGYSFYVPQVAASLTAISTQVDIAVTVTQIGVAPYYYPLSLGLSCNGMSNKKVAGVESLIDQGSSGIFAFTGVPATSSCLGSISVTLESDFLYPERPMKFAQQNGMLVFSLPLPNGALPLPTPTVVPVKAPSTAPVVPVKAPTTAPVVPIKAPSTAPVVPSVTPPTSSKIMGLSLVYKPTNQVVFNLVDGATVNLKTLGLPTADFNIKAETASGVSKVRFDNGQVEGAAPYARCGDSAGKYNSCTDLVLGARTIAAQPMDASGTPMDTGLQISFTIITGAAAPSNPPPVTGPTKSPSKAPVKSPTKAPLTPPTKAPVTLPTNAPVRPPTSSKIMGLSLVYKPTNQVVFNLVNGATVNLKTLGLPTADFNIKAETASGVSKVRFDNGQVESATPYARCGDSAGIYNSCTDLVLGAHTIAAQPMDASGTLMDTGLQISFTVITGTSTTTGPTPMVAMVAETPPSTSPLVPNVVFQADFATPQGRGLVTYAPNLFRATTADQKYETEIVAADALFLQLGGVDTVPITGMSGGWTAGFNLNQSSTVTITIRWQLEQSLTYEPDEFSEALCAIDGNLMTPFMHMSDGGFIAYNDVTLSVTLGAGPHTVSFGAYNSKKTWYDEMTAMKVQSLKVVAS
jgi:hypothetical protein